jgi:hypothetical protein
MYHEGLSRSWLHTRACTHANTRRICARAKIHMWHATSAVRKIYSKCLARIRTLHTCVCTNSLAQSWSRNGPENEICRFWRAPWTVPEGTGSFPGLTWAFFSPFTKMSYQACDCHHEMRPHKLWYTTRNTHENRLLKELVADRRLNTFEKWALRGNIDMQMTLRHSHYPRRLVWERASSRSRLEQWPVKSVRCEEKYVRTIQTKI